MSSTRREIVPLPRPVDVSIRPPGSKSLSNRALPVAAVARGVSRITGLLQCEDTDVMIDALRILGARLEIDPASRRMSITGCSGPLPATAGHLFLGNSGTSLRFLAALLAVGAGQFVLDGTPRMRQRPVGDLLAALGSLGVAARSLANNDCPPMEVIATGVNGGLVETRGAASSQFLSGLLLAAPLARAPVTIVVVGDLVSKPYIDMTLQIMSEFGVETDRQGYRQFSVPNVGYRGRDIAIEPDASGASYFFAAAAIAGGRTTVPGLGANSLQGDLGFCHLLKRMGCRVEQNDAQTTVIGGPLRGIDADMVHISDTMPTLAAVACFADSPTRIRNVAHIRRKESDRIAAMATELRRTGVEVTEHPDGLTIEPLPLRGAEFDTYDDHRIAMSLSLLGLRVPGVAIRNPGCVAKTYPDYFLDLDRLRLHS